MRASRSRLGLRPCLRAGCPRDARRPSIPRKRSRRSSTNECTANDSHSTNPSAEGFVRAASAARRPMTVLVQDFLYALRALTRRPMYAGITILVLAIAIGANTTVFSVLNGLFLRPLPYPESDRLVMVYDSYTKIANLGNAGTAIPDYLERREQAKSLESLAITAGAARTLGGEGEPLRLVTMRASASLFAVLRVAHQGGRVLHDDEATPGNDHVVVLSDKLWRARFGASESVLGRDIL